MFSLKLPLMCKIINFCLYSFFNPSFATFNFVTIEIKFNTGFLVKSNIYIYLLEFAILTNLLFLAVRSKYISGVTSEKLERLC